MKGTELVFFGLIGVFLAVVGSGDLSTGCSEAGPPANSLYVEDYGREGLGASTTADGLTFKGSEPPWIIIRVGRVVDGDTLLYRHENHEIRVRLQGIDAPEVDQEWGTRATLHLEGLVLRRDVRIQRVSVDIWGRVVAWVWAGESCVNVEMVRAGMAWHYTQYSSDARLIKAEAEARAGKTGLWQGKDPVPPWKWRKMKKKEGGEKKK